ncbi:hypothetical protein CYMTET_37359 [Cymbomonas tetramitiformis]|uniref:Uncharacterized protein n=1 Tax=Cymbomonas tetramitiformis TaxID=36881 RepID=A0AAE0F7K0_9CHLO|nr:hypothetical protein CYMTET_37359 [Cymbomonas tetramitiformis]
MAMSTAYKSGSLAGFPWWWTGRGQRETAIAEAEERFGKFGVVIATVGEKYEHRGNGVKRPWYYRAMRSNETLAEYIDKMYATDKKNCRAFEVIRGARFDGENFDGCPYFDVDRDIDIARATDNERRESDKERVLTNALDGISEFFKQEYDLKLTYADFLITDACTAKKYNFHILLRRYRFGTSENREDFVFRLNRCGETSSSSSSSSPNLLEDVDLMPYGSTQTLRTVRSCKPGTSNWFEPIARLGKSSFMSVDDKTTIDFLVTHFRHSDRVLAPTRPRGGRTSKRQRTRLESDNTMAVRKSLANASNIIPEPLTSEEYLDEALPPPHVRRRIEEGVSQLLRDKLQDETSSVNKWYTEDIIGMKTGPVGRECDQQNFLVFLDDDGHVRYHCLRDDPDEPSDTDHLGYLDMDAMWKSNGDGDESFQIPTTDLYDAEFVHGNPCAKPIEFSRGVKAVIMREEVETGKSHQAMQLIHTHHLPRDRTWYRAWRKDNFPGPMGLYSETEIIGRLPRFRGERVLMIFHRRSLRRALFRDSVQLMRFDYFFNLDDNTKISDQERLGICIDSLWRVQTTDWDLVLVDEVNSVLRNIGARNSSAGNSDGEVSVWGRLVDIVKHSKRVVLMDAMADIEVAHLLRAADVPPERTVWRNIK